MIRFFLRHPVPRRSCFSSCLTWERGVRTRGAAVQQACGLPVTTPPELVSPAPSEAYKKQKMCLLFGFTGTGYYGLQSQSGRPGPKALPTIADVLRQALLQSGAIAESNMTPISRTKWTLASRTDKGVHAARAAVSFNMETLKAQLAAPDDTLPDQVHVDPATVNLTQAEVARINSLLPPEVRVFGVAKVRRRFSAREEASSRSYEYLLPLSAIGDTGVLLVRGCGLGYITAEVGRTEGQQTQ